MKGFITSVALAAGIAAVLVPVAGARLYLEGASGGGPPVVSPFQPALPSQAANDRYAAQLKLVRGAQLTQHDVLALSRGPVSPNALDRIAAQLRVVSDSAATSDDGVSGRTIGIGVGAGVLALLLMAGLFATMQRSRRQRPAPA